MKRLIVKNLNKCIKDKRIFQEINLFFESCKIYGIVGDNGVCKTALFRVIMGLTKYNGCISICDGKENLKN